MKASCNRPTFVCFFMIIIIFMESCNCIFHAFAIPEKNILVQILCKSVEITGVTAK